MKTIKAKTTYRTQDGREFTDKKKAEWHDRLVTEKSVYESARHALGRTLAESFQTADGLPFVIGLHDYYWITPGHYGPPRTLRVDFWGNNWSWDELPNEGTTLVLLSYRDDNGEMNNSRIPRRFPINELYWGSAAAEQELRKRQMAWVESKRQALEAGGVL